MVLQVFCTAHHLLGIWIKLEDHVFVGRGRAVAVALLLLLIDFAGWVSGVALNLLVATVSEIAWLLLIPHLLLSPVGTYLTWQMQRLNR